MSSLQRRDLIALGAGISLAGSPGWMLAAANPVASSVKPTWLGFGLNKPAAGKDDRFPLTTAMFVAPRQGNKPSFQIQVNQAIIPQLKAAGDIVTFKNSSDFGDNLLLAAVLDYENVLEARLGSTSFMVLHLVGHGVLLNFDRTRGWSMQSSFPFPVTLLRESQGGNVQADAQQYLAEAFTDSKNSFSSSFAKTASRLAPRWKEAGAGHGFNIRIVSSTIHPEAQTKLTEWGIGKNVNATWLGHLASAAMCEGLEVPVVPYSENQALGNYTYLFSERLVAQNVKLPEESDIDIRLHVSLRNVGREIKYRSQLLRWEAARMVVMNIRILDDSNEELVAVRLGYQDERADALAREEDNSPARDAHFFDMAIYRGLQTLFAGIEKNDGAMLAKVFVKPDERQQKGLLEFRRRYRRAFEKTG